MGGLWLAWHERAEPRGRLDPLRRQLWHWRRPSVAFCGDSHLWTVPYDLAAQHWGAMRTANLAVAGATITDVAKQVPQALRYQPDLLVVMAGTNDLATRTDDNILGDWRALMALRPTASPVKAVALSILLQRDGAKDARIDGLNAQLADAARSAGWAFLDVNAALSMATQRARWLRDEVHLNSAGQQQLLHHIHR